MWKVKYWQAVIDKSPPNVPRWKLTNVSDEIWRGSGRRVTARQQKAKQSWETEFELSSGQSLFVCGVSTMSIHLVFWFKLKSIKRGGENWCESGKKSWSKNQNCFFATILDPEIYLLLLLSVPFSWKMWSKIICLLWSRLTHVPGGPLCSKQGKGIVM